MKHEKKQAKLSKANVSALAKLAKKIDQHKEQAAKLRDEIRETLDEYNELAENLDLATNDLEDAARNIERAADFISQTV